MLAGHLPGEDVGRLTKFGGQRRSLTGGALHCFQEFVLWRPHRSASCLDLVDGLGQHPSESGVEVARSLSGCLHSLPRQHFAHASLRDVQVEAAHDGE